MQDLIRQLRAFAQGCRGSMWQSRDETIRLMDEAAEALTTAQTEAEALRARVAELEALSEARRDALFDLMDSLGAICGHDHELEGWSITPERCAEMRALSGSQT